MKEKYYEDPSENAKFLRCVDVLSELVKKYGPGLKRKWDFLAQNGPINMEYIINIKKYKHYQKYIVISKNSR